MKYSVRARIITPQGLFVSHAWGWDPVSVSQQTLNKLEREIKKKYERAREQPKRREIRKKRRV